MCMEDIRIGKKRYARFTRVVAGTPVVFTADARRVAIRLCGAWDNGASGFRAQAVNERAIILASSSPFININKSNPIGDATMEQHGNVVQESFTVTVVTDAVTVMETLLDNTDTAPQ